MPSHEPGPFHAAVEIVDDQEAAAQQVVAQPRGFFVAEHPAADFDGVDPRVVEQALVHDRQRLAFVRGVDARQPLHALDQVLFGIRPVGEPAAAATGARADAGVGEPHEAEFRVRIHGDAAAGLRPGVGAQHARRASQRLRRGRGRSGDSGDAPCGHDGTKRRTGSTVPGEKKGETQRRSIACAARRDLR